MPGGILDVLWVDGLVKLELSRSLFVLVGVIVSDAALPVLGRQVGLQLDLSIEVSDGLRNPRPAKVLFPAQLQDARRQRAHALLRWLIEVGRHKQRLHTLQGAIEIAAAILLLGGSKFSVRAFRTRCPGDA